MSWEFKVGQKVVCVNDRRRNPRRFDYSGWFIKAGGIYTIHALKFSPADGKHQDNDTISLFFIEGDQGPCGCCGQVIGFNAARFRPLVTDTQSWLKEVLETPPPAKVRGPAPTERLPIYSSTLNYTGNV